MSLTKASDIVKAPTRDAGGDNEVPRDGMGRPRIIVPCDACNAAGSIRSHKSGKPIKCPKRCAAEDGVNADGIFVPKGHALKAYTRTTTFIDALEDKSNLMAWAERMVLLGVADDHKLLNDVLAYGSVLRDGDASVEEKKSAKDQLNRKAQIAKKKAGAEEKADKGTALHGLSELLDMGEEFPRGISFEDFDDLDAYRDITAGFRHVHMEKLVVHDNLRVAGTPDRISQWIGHGHLIAPNGYVFRPNELICTDLKTTGNIDYGQLKMAMQMALYTRSSMYDHTTGKRSSQGNLNQDWGIIWHVASGSGEGKAYWADLTLGWKAVELARDVRQIRGQGRNALTVLASPRAA